MAHRTYRAADCLLLDALFGLVASCAALLAEEASWAGRAVTGAQRRRLAAASRRLEALALLARVVADRPWKEERTPIRGEPPANIEPTYAKAIPIESDKEQAPDS